jgi:hypothetical protein
MQACRTEMRDLMPHSKPGEQLWDLRWELIEPLPERIAPWSPANARWLFLRRFYALGGKS